MLQTQDTRLKKTLDPILTLQVSQDDETTTSSEAVEMGSRASAVTSLCFFNSTNSPQDVISGSVATDEDTDSDSDGDDLELQCGRLLRSEKRSDADVTAKAREVSACLSLNGRLLGTCHANGGSFLWDLSQRKMLQNITVNRGPGLTLRRLDDAGSGSHFLYQTRDPEGTVGLYDLNASSNNGTVEVKAVAQFETQSRTFCAAAPCKGNPNLVVMPCEENSFAVVRDWREPKDHPPVAFFHGVEGIGKGRHQVFSSPEEIRKHGMLTSLAMTESNGETTIVCGMESGTVAFHDLAMLKGNRSTVNEESCSLSLCKDPILSLDVASSPTPQSALHSSLASMVAIAGMAGNAEDLAELPACDRGRLAVVKAGVRPDGLFHARLRARLSTCDGALTDGISGKSGVALCRFRPDGRIFAVGGWDKRLRVFDRGASATPLAILRGHAESVNAMDWSSDAAVSGLLATGSSDGRVHIWRCFPKTALTEML